MPATNALADEYQSSKAASRLQIFKNKSIEAASATINSFAPNQKFQSRLSKYRNSKCSTTSQRPQTSFGNRTNSVVTAEQRMQEQRFAIDFFKDLDSKKGYQNDQGALDQKRGRNTALNTYMNQSLTKLNSRSPGRSMLETRSRLSNKNRTDCLQSLVQQLEGHSAKKIPINSKLENEYVQLSDLVNDYMKQNKKQQTAEQDDGKMIELTQDEL